MAPTLDVKKVAMIGCGSMGGGMAQLLAENNYHVCLSDPSEDSINAVLHAAEASKIPSNRFSKHTDYKSLCAALERPKVFFWSLPHGGVGDTVLEGLLPFMEKEDMIVDCGNEHWENTERRQGKCVTKGIRYVGCGVSGGYQAARRGPSMCPGADDETLALVLPLLKTIAARDSNGKPATGAVGTGGAGHYCKMIHNGVEHGMMSAIAEAYTLMRDGLAMSLDEIGDVFESWNSKGELEGTFLIWISRDICRTKNEDGQFVLDEVEDKVVQDYTGEEGTGVWSNTEAVERHVPAPTLTTAHYLRIASGDRHQREQVQKAFGAGSGDPNKDHMAVFAPQKLEDITDRAAFLEDLRMAVFTTCLAAYCQGMLIIEKADKDKHFNINYAELMQVWRAGCIIQADYISTKLLKPIYDYCDPSKSSSNPLLHSAVSSDLKRGLASLKKVVLKSVEADAVVPALSATLEYLKVMTSTALPTNFYEAQLDYFGKHMYDKKGDDEQGLPTEGKWHWEWKAA
ncbi:hypothetical protein LTR62_005694 [Meristemomyces frigidus]|uniref:6-phosphogluconate dehydrogenase, decarboxylating n=1 Tax=Meristemomyces frigidus TaxID=1508187 RepID=A0AAN7TE96_9PEZI|nr:hypothetical protein LTR62_005694 [Meristemomyces frigidus]